MSRPRKHPDGTTASQRVALSTAELIRVGGARKTFRLSPQASAALVFLVESSKDSITETAVVEAALLAEATRRKRVIATQAGAPDAESR